MIYQVHPYFSPHKLYIAKATIGEISFLLFEATILLLLFNEFFICEEILNCTLNAKTNVGEKYMMTLIAL